MPPKSTTFFNTESAVELGALDLTRLKDAALADPVGRARLCLHLDHESLVHQMVIVFTEWSYVRPHRHSSKTESFHAIEGEFDVIFFNEAGTSSAACAWVLSVRDFLSCTDSRAVRGTW